MANNPMKPNTIRGLFAMVLLIGLLQILHIYQSNLYSIRCLYPGSCVRRSENFIATVTETRSVTEMMNRSEPSNTSDPTYGRRNAIMSNPAQTSSKQELLLRKLSVYRANKRAQQNPSRVELDTSLLGASNEKWSKRTGTILPLRERPEKYFLPNYNPMKYGIQRENKGFLTFGIPTVRRPNTDTIYIFKTLDSLIENIDETEMLDVTLVVLLSDNNATYNQQLGTWLYERYVSHINSGFIRVIEAPADIYPSLEKIKLTYNDPIERVRWRTKQNIDFAFLHLYCTNISKYYIQMEDDVISSKHLIRDITLFTKGVKTNWFLLEFSRLGFIGKFFHSSDLPWVANYLLTFFDQMPCDLFLGKMRVFKGQHKPIHSIQSLFQHIGKFSSLKNKIMPTIDDKFKDKGSTHLPMNDLPAGIQPNVTIDTNLNAFRGSKVMDAYNNKSDSYFWVSFPSVNSYIRLKFEKPTNFTRVIITTGDADTKHDFLKAGTLQFSSISTDDINCKKYKGLASFVGGEIDTKAMGITVPGNIMCLKIVITQKSKSWVKFRNIILL